MAERRNFRRLENLNIRMVKAQQQLRFLKSCREMRIIPNRYKVRNTFRETIPDKWFGDLSFRIMKKHSNDAYFKIRRLEFEYRKEREKKVENEGEMELKENEDRIIKKCENIEKKKERELKDKFVKLCENNNFKEIINYDHEEPKYVVYLTECGLQRETVKLLNNHANFTLGNVRRPILNFLTDLQYARHINQEGSIKTEVSRIISNLEVEKLKTGEKQNYKAMSRYRKAEEDLIKNDLRIVRSDKSNQIVVMEEGKYKEKMEEMIKDFFKESKKDNCKNINKILKEKLKKIMGDDGRMRILINNQAETPEMFGFIKTHKDNMPMRPVVTMRGGPLEFLDKYLLKILKEILMEPKRAIRNTEELVTNLEKFGEKNEEKNIILASLDIKSMYPSIQKEFIVKEVEKVAKEKEQEIMEKFCLTSEAFIDLLRFFLDNGQSNFNGKTYFQKDGLGIGSSTSPILANYAIGIIEERALQELEEICILYNRYVDDIIIIVKEEKEHEIDNLRKKFKEILPTLELTLQKEENNKLQFLDLIIYKERNELQWRFHQNNNKSGAILNYNSDHSRSVKNNIAKNLINRAYNLTSKRQKLKAAIETGKRLLQNQYPKKLILKYLYELQPKKKKEKKAEVKEKKIPISLTYINNVTRQIKSRDKKLRIVSKNGIKILKMGMKKKGGRKKEETKDCIYKINLSCGNCYIGQTKREIKVRLAEHQRNIKNKNMTSLLVKHIEDCKCKIKDNNPWEILEVEKNLRKRQIKEAIFITTNEKCVSEESVTVCAEMEDFLKNHCRMTWQP